jgi:hypothetical protein
MGKTFRRDDDNNYRDARDRKKKSSRKFREDRLIREIVWKDTKVEPDRKKQKDSLHNRQW